MRNTFNSKKNKNYLPSKKFTYSLISIVVCGAIIFVIANLFSSKNNFFLSKKDAKIQTGNLTINQMVQRDSDGDGVLDWEESLWGTDLKKQATFDDIPDATYIANKRGEIKTDPSQENKTLTETDKFAREFFAAFTAMKSSGQVDSNTINNFSSTLGERIVDASVLDKYSGKDVVLTKGDEPKDQEDYYLAAGTLFEEYKEKGIGEELEITGGVASAGETGDNQSSEQKLLQIAEAYQDFARELLLVPVPESLKDYHLKIINSSNNTGVAVINMSKIITDPIIGISGLSQYEKYSGDLITSVNDLEAFLTTNGIISSDNTTP